MKVKKQRKKKNNSLLIHKESLVNRAKLLEKELLNKKKR